jgi:hypothetical protein
VLALSLMAATAAFPASNRTQAKDTFIVGAEGDPILLDGSLVSDGTSLPHQIFETCPLAEPRIDRAGDFSRSGRLV